jgi:phosphate starvation-inducible PhoH-like protein
MSQLHEQRTPPPQHTDREPIATVLVPAGDMPHVVGSRDGNLRAVEQRLGVRLVPADGAVMVFGNRPEADKAARALETLLHLIQTGRNATPRDLELVLQAVIDDTSDQVKDVLNKTVIITHRNKSLTPKTLGQARYVHTVAENDVVFCTGPAGTGKTFLAMAMAMAALRSGEVSRIVLSRPIVEAGEQLGFLPGDMLEKVQPYLRPLHDALTDITGFDRLQKLLGRSVIEVMPLAYMRGRTVNDAFIVLDEAQNTTPAQVKMFLTRMGFGSKIIVTGDVTQTDLPPGFLSGLQHAISLLAHVKGVGVCHLDRNDIVRHPLVQRIVDAYENSPNATRRPHDDTEPTTQQPPAGNTGGDIPT